jgi:hypothetical protein
MSERDFVYPDIHWCPSCGLPQVVCDCTEDDMNRWADEQLYADEPSTYWVNVWDSIPSEDEYDD